MEYLMLKNTEVMQFDQKREYIRVLRPELMPYGMNCCQQRCLTVRNWKKRQRSLLNISKKERNSGNRKHRAAYAEIDSKVRYKKIIVQ